MEKQVDETNNQTSKNQGQFENDVQIESGAKIYPNVYFIGKCKVDSGTKIYPFSTIENSEIGKDCEIKSSHIENSVIGNNVKIGPFAHLRPNSKIGDDCKLGNFVEVKNSTLKRGTKAAHLSYIGDAEIGENCNIGCGVIFANYNGKTKSKTIIEDSCFIGSNSNLIAPVVVKNHTYICAGTTLTQSTQPYDFVIGRSREIIKPLRSQNYLKGEN